MNLDLNEDGDRSVEKVTESDECGIKEMESQHVLLSSRTRIKGEKAEGKP